MYCQNCGKEIEDNATWCKHCGKQVIAPPELTHQVTGQVVTKSPGVAAVLSFFAPGLGQVYNGQILKGILIIIFTPLVTLFSIFLMGTMHWGALLIIPLWWYNFIVNAYQYAEYYNEKGV